MRHLVPVLLLLSATALGRPWQGIEPGVSRKADVIAKFGQPTRSVSKDGKETLAYLKDEAIKGTLQAQFRVDPKTQVVERIDVFPATVIDKDTIEGTYGGACAGAASGEGCYVKKLTDDFRTYLQYTRMGLTVFFKEDGKTVHSLVFLPAKGAPARDAP